MPEVHGEPWMETATKDLIIRNKWGALPPKEEMDPLPLPIRHIVYTCDAGIINVCKTKEECIQNVQEIQKRDMEEKGLPDIAYNFLIGDDNNIYEGRGFDHRPAIYYEDPDKYDRAISIAYIGVHESKFLHWSMHESSQWLKKLGIYKSYIDEKVKIIDNCDKEDYFDEMEEQEEETTTTT